jgi:hypothetical protein
MPNKGRLRTDYKDNKVASLFLQDVPTTTGYSLYKLPSFLYETAWAGVNQIYSFWSKSSDTIKPKQQSSDKTVQITEQFESLETEVKALFSKLNPLDKEVKALKEQKKEIPPALTLKRTKIKEEIDDLYVKKVVLIPALIKRHAQKRVDFFFLLMIALYNKKVEIKKGKTILQHGKGSNKTGTAGCHASLFPTIETTPIDTHGIKDENYLNRAVGFVASFFTEAIDASSETEEEEDEDLEETSGNTTQDEPNSIIDYTFFQDVMNTTTELPVVVNQFDCILEGKYGNSPMVDKCLSILNAVSLGQMSPLEGLKLFGHHMNQFFVHVNFHYLTKEPDYRPLKATVAYPKAFKKILEYQREGTLKAFNNVGKLKHIRIDSAYLVLQLGLSNEISTLKKLGQLGSPDAVMEEEMKRMQLEIFSSPSYRAKGEVKKEILARAPGLTS